MNQSLLKIRQAIHYRYDLAKQNVLAALRRYWFKAFLLGLAAFMINQKDLSLDLHLNAIQQTVDFSGEPDIPENMPDSRPMNISHIQTRQNDEKQKVSHQPAGKRNDPPLANTFSNLSFSVKEFANHEADSKYVEKRHKQKGYVARFANIAKGEMEKYGIPASITLAQGLLESNVGESLLAKKNNNHFGIKCFSKSCKKGHCSNFSDDHHKDFFRIYKNTWESYRSHSLLLQRSRYKPLFKLSRTDYKGWAYGLQKAGYATDRRYAEKLINLIEDLNLHQYDR